MVSRRRGYSVSTTNRFVHFNFRLSDFVLHTWVYPPHPLPIPEGRTKATSPSAVNICLQNSQKPGWVHRRGTAQWLHTALLAVSHCAQQLAAARSCLECRRSTTKAHPHDSLHVVTLPFPRQPHNTRNEYYRLYGLVLPWVKYHHPQPRPYAFPPRNIKITSRYTGGLGAYVRCAAGPTLAHDHVAQAVHSVCEG